MPRRCCRSRDRPGAPLCRTTVKTHVGHLLAKLGLPDRVHLVIFAYESDLLEPGTI
jgi:hypothetical protein